MGDADTLSGGGNDNLRGGANDRSFVYIAEHGARVAIFAVTLPGLHHLTANDFVL